MAIPRLRSDIVIGVAALVVSAASLVTIIRHAMIMNKMLAAETLPYLEMEDGNVMDDLTAGIYFELRNSGVGPARIETFQLFYKDKPISDWFVLLEKCCGLDRTGLITSEDFEAAVGFLVTADAAPIMLPQNSRRPLLRYEKNLANQSIYAALNTERRFISARACYCSVFDECWVTDFKDFHPTSVKSCNGINLKSDVGE